MNQLTLFFSAANKPEIARWALVDTDSRSIVAEGEGLANASNTHTNGRIVLVVDGANVTTRHLELPKKITSQVRAAVPQLLADQLAGIEDQAHCAIGDLVEAGRLVAVVGSTHLKALLDGMNVAGFRPDLAVADHMLLGAAGDGAVLVQAEGRSLYAHGDGSGASIEKDLLQFVLPALLAGATSKVIVRGADSLPMVRAALPKGAECSEDRKSVV